MALKVIPGETRDDLLRIAIDLPESWEVFRRIHSFHNPLSSKRRVECCKKWLKRLDKSLKRLDKPLESLGKTLER